VEPAFQNIAGQLAAIKATRARTRLLPADALPSRERAAPRLDEGFWRQVGFHRWQARRALPPPAAVRPDARPPASVLAPWHGARAAECA